MNEKTKGWVEASIRIPTRCKQPSIISGKHLAKTTGET
jgi:hypothetical protein